MFDDVKISIIMSAYNAEKFIDQSIKSILSQTFEKFIFIAVNNGSNDKTGEILQSYAEKDSRLKIINIEGPSTYIEGRAKAIECVTTEWFAIMDADDIAEPKRLERQISFIKSCSKSIGVIGTWASSINEKNTKLAKIHMEPTSLEKYEELYKKNEAIVPLDPSTIIKKSVFDLAGGYRKESVPASDLDLWYRISETGYKIIIIPEELMRYRIHANSSSVYQDMFQRQKTHFVNYNMRKRRAGLKEISWNLFLTTIWTKPLYKFPRLRNDLGLIFYKRAGFSFAKRNYLNLVIYLITAFFFKPLHVTKQIYKQIIKPEIKKIK